MNCRRSLHPPSFGLRSRTRRRAEAALASVLLLWCAACVGNMQEQPRYDPLEPTVFFDDNKSAREPVRGTVPRSLTALGRATEVGFENGEPVTRIPMAVTAEVLAAGETQFNVYCAPCHSMTGDGDGMIVRRGFRRPPSFFIPRLVEAPPGHIFDVISNGFGAMPPYNYLLTVPERWAVVAYVKSLQLLSPATVRDAAAVPQKEGEKR